MNNLQELVSHGIEESTARNMLAGYSKKIGTMNGIYRIKDIEYNFSSKGRIVTLECSECGKVITRVMISGRNKWSELIKTCNCEKERKKERRKQEVSNDRIQNAALRIGETYGDFEIVSLRSVGDRLKYIVRCNECGAEKEISVNNFNLWKNHHCTKHSIQPIKFDSSYIGKKKNYLTVIGYAKDMTGKRAFLCKCDCGKTKAVKPTYWEMGNVKSCGCKHDELNSTHGGSNDRLYHVWNGMKGRCDNKNNPNYSCYGGRGIRICAEWYNYAEFKEWAYKNGYDENAPFGECTIDRIDVNGNYEPGNCRWISNMEQQKNKRPREELKDGGYRKFITLNGERISRKKACDMAGVNVGTFQYRTDIKGMSNEDALAAKEKMKN